MQSWLFRIEARWLLISSPNFVGRFGLVAAIRGIAAILPIDLDLTNMNGPKPSFNQGP